MKATAKNVCAALLKETGATFELVKGEGYWYFINNQFNAEGVCVRHETYSVYTMYLSDLPFNMWMVEGRAFYRKLAGLEG